jgi:hypothetical protein
MSAGIRSLQYRPSPHDTTTEANPPFLVHEGSITNSPFIVQKKVNRYFIIVKFGAKVKKREEVACAEDGQEWRRMVVAVQTSMTHCVQVRSRVGSEISFIEQRGKKG